MFLCVCVCVCACMYALLCSANGTIARKSSFTHQTTVDSTSTDIGLLEYNSRSVCLLSLYLTYTWNLYLMNFILKRLLILKNDIRLNDTNDSVPNKLR